MEDRNFNVELLKSMSYEKVVAIYATTPPHILARALALSEHKREEVKEENIENEEVIMKPKKKPKKKS